MRTEQQTLSLIRKYVTDSQDDRARSNSTGAAVVSLLEDRPSALSTVEKHFDSFVGKDRFWLYALVGLLTANHDETMKFYAKRMPCEDDPACCRLLEAAERNKRKPNKEIHRNQ